MKKLHFSRNDAGTTMVELVIAAGIFGFTMSMLVGSVITMTAHNTMADQRAEMTSFNRSALEDLRGRSLDDILNYDIPVDDPNMGTLTLPGVGDVQPRLFAVLTDPNTGAVDTFQLGVDDPNTLANVPNPLEIVVVLQKVNVHHETMDQGGMTEGDAGGTTSYPTRTSVSQRMSTLITY